MEINNQGVIIHNVNIIRRLSQKQIMIKLIQFYQ